MIIYWIIWFIALKNFNVTAIDSIRDSNFDIITFKFVNESFLPIIILDLNLFNKNKKLTKKLTDFKLNINGYSEINKNLNFISDDYKYIEVVFKAMFTEYKIESTL